MRHVSSRAFPLDRVYSERRHRLFAGSLIILTTFLPVLAYFAKDAVRAGSAGAVVMCGLVYGTTDFPTARGVWDCLIGRKSQWTPTNARSQNNHSWGVLGEALFGLLLCVPLATNFLMIYFPCFYLFAGSLFSVLPFPFCTMSENREFRVPIKRGQFCRLRQFFYCLQFQPRCLCMCAPALEKFRGRRYMGSHSKWTESRSP